MKWLFQKVPVVRPSKERKHLSGVNSFDMGEILLFNKYDRKMKSNQLQFISREDPIHLEQPEWCAVVDFSPDQVVATRRRILNRAVA